MSMIGWIRKVLGIVDKRVDYFAVIFAAVLLAAGKRLTDETKKRLEEDAQKLFKGRTHQSVFASQVAFYYNGGSKGIKNLNYLVKIINKNSKLYPRWNAHIPYYLLNAYKSDDIEQQRLFEFLHTIKPDI